MSRERSFSRNYGNNRTIGKSNGQDPELVQIGIEYIVISVGNMITLQETVPLLEGKGKLSNFKECSIWVMNKQ